MILKHDQTLADLRSHIALMGRLSWIGIRPKHQQAMIMPEKAILLENKGIEGDHIAKGSSRKRQVTLIQEEHLPVVSKLTNSSTVNPEFLRRNLVVRGINLLALKSEKFSIGECVLEGTGLCHPCSRMEEALGTGGYNAMRGHGGITAIVISGGTIKIGDKVAMFLG
jgi:MOSC domain-containing protein YiiM